MKKISFLGDIICQLPFLKAAQQRGNDFYTTFAALNPLLNESDFVVANLETPIAGENSGYSNELYSFNTPSALLDSLKKVKIDLFLTANNHCLDRGIDGLKSTLQELDKRRMAHTGTSIKEGDPKFFVTNVGDTKCAFISYTSCINEDKWIKYKKDLYDFNLNMLIDIDKHLSCRNEYRTKHVPLYNLRKKLGNCISHSLELKFKHMLGIKLHPTIDNEPLDQVCGIYLTKVKSIIQQAKEQADLVFFLPHCGGQFNKNPGKLAQNIFKTLLEYNVNAIVASHPHTIQKCGVSNGKPYAFSLGNVSTSPSYPYTIKETLPQYGMIFHIYVDNKKIVKSSFSLIKSIEDKNHYPLVYPITDVKDSSLEKDVSSILSRISDNQPFPGIKKEYDCLNF